MKKDKNNQSKLKKRKNTPYKIALGATFAGAVVIGVGILTGAAGGVVTLATDSRENLLEQYNYAIYENLYNDEDAFLKAQDENVYYKLVKNEATIETINKVWQILLTAGTTVFAASALATTAIHVHNSIKDWSEINVYMDGISEGLQKAAKDWEEISEQYSKLINDEINR